MKTCEHKYEVKWVTPEGAIREAHRALMAEKPTLAFSILNKWLEQANAQYEVDRACQFERAELQCQQCPPPVLPGVKVVEPSKS